MKIKFPLLRLGMKKTAQTSVRFVVCVKNEGYEASWSSAGSIALYRMLRLNAVGISALSTKVARTTATAPTASCRSRYRSQSREHCSGRPRDLRSPNYTVERRRFARRSPFGDTLRWQIS